MISFEFSITNLVIMAAIAFLAVFYVIILLKLKPSTEKKDKDHHKKDVLPEKQEPPPNRLIFVNSLKTKKKATPPPGAQTQISPQKIWHPFTKTTHPSTPQGKNQEAPKPVAKPENQPSNLHCAHHFGYLRKLPKNTRIPTECLGCPQIVECMTTLNVEKERVKTHVTNS